MGWSCFYDLEVSSDCRVIATITRGLKDGSQWDSEKSWLLITFLDENYESNRDPVDSFKGLWSSPTFSPDSARLAAIKNADSNNAQVELFDLSTKEPRILLSSQGWDAIRRVVWIDNFTLALEVSEGNTIKYFALTTDGKVFLMTSMPEQFERDSFHLTHACVQESN
jgi:hypothetical protein